MAGVGSNQYVTKAGGATGPSSSRVATFSRPSGPTDRPLPDYTDPASFIGETIHAEGWDGPVSGLVTGTVVDGASDYLQLADGRDVHIDDVHAVERDGVAVELPVARVRLDGTTRTDRIGLRRTYRELLRQEHPRRAARQWVADRLAGQ